MLDAGVEIVVCSNLTQALLLTRISAACKLEHVF